MSKDVTLSSGVRVRLVAVPAMLIGKALNSVQEPSVPMFHNESKDRDEPNPLDPQYLKAVEDFKALQGEKTVHAYLANGIKVLEVPEDKYSLESDEWIEGLEYVGLDVPRAGIGRKVYWLQYHILGDQDLTDILSGIAIAGGVVTEDQVQQAAETFRSNESGNTNSTVQAAADLRFTDTPTDNITRIGQ